MKAKKRSRMDREDREKKKEERRCKKLLRDVSGELAISSAKNVSPQTQAMVNFANLTKSLQSQR